MRLFWCFGPSGVRRETIPLERGLEVGRGASDAVERGRLRVADGDMSRDHFELAPSPVGWTLTDYSRNGTFVDGQRVPSEHPVEVAPNSVIRAGSCTFVLSRSPRARAVGDAPRGESAAAHDLRARIAQLAPLDVPVLVLGETGAGKEYVARALHAHSGRPPSAFTWVNCSELEQDLGRGELFGTRKGAFTGAVDRGGLIADAEGGTLFLDEVGNLSRDMQGKLLRYLDDRTYRLVGGPATTSAARVVAATNRDLEAAVKSGDFREDFLARLRAAVPPIELPPLRERREDLLEWCDHYLQGEAAKLGRGTSFAYSAGFAEAVLLHPWPRNLRALHEALGAAVLASTDDLLTDEALPEEVRATRRRARTQEQPVSAALPARVGQALTRELLHEVLTACRGNLKQASAKLGAERTKVYREARRHGLDLDGYRVPKSGGE